MTEFVCVEDFCPGLVNKFSVILGLFPVFPGLNHYKSRGSVTEYPQRNKKQTSTVGRSSL